MRRTLSVRHDCFPLSRPFRISRGVKTAADVVTVSVEERGIAGYGEGVPYPRYGESLESVIAQIEAARMPVEQGTDRQELLTAIPPGAARNAIDCALWDLEARLSGRTVAQVIGVPEPTPMISALTIGIDTPDAMAAAAVALADAPLLKIKVDRNDPGAAIKAVRSVAPGAKLIVDPNESWDRTMVQQLQDVLLEAQVALLEQPVPADQDDWLDGFSPAVPICADEAVHVAADLPRVAQRYQVVNVKLDKSGGLTAALQLAEAARACGLGLMTGCMISSSRSIAPALHVARLSDFVDLDGPLWLKKDLPGGVTDDGGRIVPPATGFWGTV